MWILGTLYCCSFPLSLANWGQRTGLFLIYLTWCSKTGSIIAPPLTKPLSSSSCFLLLTSCHHQSFAFYLFSHLISQNHHWLYFLSIFLPYFFFFYHPATLNLNVYGSFHSCALFFLLLPSTLHLRDLCLGWEVWVCVCRVCVCVCSRAPVCVSPVGRVFWGSSFTPTVPVSLADSWFPIYWHPLLKWGYPCWSIVSRFNHSQDHLSHCRGCPLSLLVLWASWSPPFQTALSCRARMW